MPSRAASRGSIRIPTLSSESATLIRVSSATARWKAELTCAPSRDRARRDAAERSRPALQLWAVAIDVVRAVAGSALQARALDVAAPHLARVTRRERRLRDQAELARLGVIRAGVPHGSGAEVPGKRSALVHRRFRTAVLAVLTRRGLQRLGHLLGFVGLAHVGPLPAHAWDTSRTPPAHSGVSL